MKKCKYCQLGLCPYNCPDECDRFTCDTHRPKNQYMVIYQDGRRTRPITKEEAEGLYESFDAVYLLKIERINSLRSITPYKLD